MKKLIMLGLALLLAGCGPDPVRIEKADAIRRESETQYLATATAVAIQARATAIAIADDEAVMAATRDDRIAWQENVMWWSTVAVVLVLLALATSLSVAVGGGAVAVVRYANLQARLVWLDKATHTFPILVEKGLLVDFEAGERARLDAPSQPHVGRLVGSVQARVIGLLTQAAVQMAKSVKDGRAGSSLPAIAHSVPILDAGEWLPEIQEPQPAAAEVDL